MAAEREKLLTAKEAEDAKKIQVNLSKLENGCSVPRRPRKFKSV